MKGTLSKITETFNTAIWYIPENCRELIGQFSVTRPLSASVMLPDLEM